MNVTKKENYEFEVWFNPTDFPTQIFPHPIQSREDKIKELAVSFENFLKQKFSASNGLSQHVHVRIKVQQT